VSASARTENRQVKLFEWLYSNGKHSNVVVIGNSYAVKSRVEVSSE